MDTKMNGAGDQQPINKKKQYQGYGSIDDTVEEKKRLAERLGDARQKLVFAIRAIIDKKGEKIVEIDLDGDFQKKIDAVSDIKQKRDMVFSYIMKNLRGKYPMADGRIVVISRTTAKKYSNYLTEVKLRMTPQLEQIVSAAHFVGMAKDVAHPRFVHFVYYDVTFTVAETIYRGRLNIGINKNGDAILYDLNQINEI